MKIGLALLLAMMVTSAGAENLFVPAGEAPKTDAQIRELANLEILSGRALYNSGQLRIETLNLKAQLAAANSQIDDLKAQLAKVTEGHTP